VSERQRRHWFLPEVPDVVGLLLSQAAVTTGALDDLAAWAAGDADAADRVRAAEPHGDAAKRELLDQMRDAFVLELEPEDLFTLSRGLDWLLDYACDLIEEAEAMSCPPDAGLAEMSSLLAEATHQLSDAIGLLTTDPDGATAGADSAIKTARHMEHIYYGGTARLLEVEERGERIARRELYRRCERISETVIDVAERVVYSVVKES